MTRLYIKEIDIISFGKFENTKFKFNKNFNLIYGENESGKSTIADFIEGVLYGFDQGKKRTSFSYKKEKYRPKNSYKYAGKILFSFSDSDILVERNFENGDYSIFDISNKKEIEGPKSDLNFPGKYLFGLSYDAYQNLIRNYQSQDISGDSKKILIEYFMDSTSDLNFSANKAIEILEKNLEELGTPRAYTKPYYIINKKIEDLEKERKNLNRLRANYKEDLIKLYDQRKLLESYKDKLKDLKTKRDDFRSNLAFENYKEEEKTKKELNHIIKELKKYRVYENTKPSYFENMDRLIDNQREDTINQKNQTSYWVYLILGVLIVLISYLLKKTFILFLLIFIYPLYLFRNKALNNSYKTLINDQLSIHSLKDLKAYRIFKKSYYDYLDLMKEKQNLEEVLSILDRQEKKNTGFNSNVDFDIRGIDEEISRIERDFSNLSLENIDLEKKLSFVEEKLQRETSLEEDIRYNKDKFKKIKEEISANKLAIDMIQSSQKDGKEKFKDLNLKINQIIRQISKEDYKEISYDENLKPMIVKADNSLLSLDQVSTGFFDLLNFALKLVLREDISSNKYIIFDDAFVNFDEKRLKDALYFLLDLAYENQIIYFTCHNREKEIFYSEDILVNIIMLE